MYISVLHSSPSEARELPLSGPRAEASDENKKSKKADGRSHRAVFTVALRDGLVAVNGGSRAGPA